MIDAIKAAVTAVITMLGEFVQAITTADGALYGLLPLLGIGIAVSVVMLGAKVIRSFTWGA